MEGVEELKARFAKVFYKAVNEVLTEEKEAELMEEKRNLEDTLHGMMGYDAFVVFYEEVHKASWGSPQDCWDYRD